MRFAYPCEAVVDEIDLRLTGCIGYNIRYRDIPEALSCASTWSEALYMATDVLRAALWFYTEKGKPLPTPSALQPGEIMIAPPPIVSAKLALYTAMREQDVSVAELAGRLEITEPAAGKLIKLDYGSHIATIERALNTLGLTLMVDAQPLPQQPTTESQSASLARTA